MSCQTFEAFVPSAHRLLGIGSEIIKCLLIQKFFSFRWIFFFFLLVLSYLFIFLRLVEKGEKFYSVSISFLLQVIWYKGMICFKNV